MNLWMSAVLPTLLSPATTTVTSVSLANFMFVILSLTFQRLLIPKLSLFEKLVFQCGAFYKTIRLIIATVQKQKVHSFSVHVMSAHQST